MRSVLFGLFTFFGCAPLFAQMNHRVSVGSNDEQAQGNSIQVAMTPDARFVAFASEAANLVPGDTNQWSDIFLHDRQSRTTVRASIDSSGGEANYESLEPAVSADGRYVAFSSHSSNLVPNDTNARQDVFVHDLWTGETRRVSVASDGTQADGSSYGPVIAGNGPVIAFVSTAKNLGADVYSSVFTHDLASGETRLESRAEDGSPVNAYFPALTFDARYLTFSTSARSLGSDSNEYFDVYRVDRTDGSLLLVSVGDEGRSGNNGSWASSISQDGGVIAYSSGAANLVERDENGYDLDIFVRDIDAGTTELVSRRTDGSNLGSRSSDIPVLSLDGRHVAFVACELYQWNGHCYVHDRRLGMTSQVDLGHEGGPADSDCLEGPNVAISADGQLVAFVSLASNIVPDDTNSSLDVFLRERCFRSGAWTVYGEGFPGTLGVPELTPDQEPAVGEHLSLHASNSRGVYTLGFLLIGAAWDQPTDRGGRLYVAPSQLVPLVLPPAGGVVGGRIPLNESLCGQSAFLQLIEEDPGAEFGLSFSQGLEIVIGYGQ